MVHAGNKAKQLSSADYNLKIIPYYHHHHHHHQQQQQQHHEMYFVTVVLKVRKNLRNIFDRFLFSKRFVKIATSRLPSSNVILILCKFPLHYQHLGNFQLCMISSYSITELSPYANKISTKNSDTFFFAKKLRVTNFFLEKHTNRAESETFKFFLKN